MAIGLIRVLNRDRRSAFLHPLIGERFAVGIAGSGTIQSDGAGRNADLIGTRVGDRRRDAAMDACASATS